MRYLLLLLALTSCTARPPIELHTDAVIARANSIEDARWIAGIAEALIPRVEELLGTQVPVPVVVDYDNRMSVTVEVPAPGEAARFSFVTDGSTLTHFDSTGRGRKDRIKIGGGVLASLRYIVAHELVHWSARDVWYTLPITIEEGLGDYIGMQIEPEFAAFRRAMLYEAVERATIEDFQTLLQLTHVGYPSLSDDRRTTMYAVGLYLVEQLGIERLRALCERAAREGLSKIPSEWIFELVTLPPHLAH